jgi:hypothetical protein
MKRPLKPLKPRDLESTEPMLRRARRLYSVAYGCILHPYPPRLHTPAARKRERRGWRQHAFIRRLGSGAWTAIRGSCWWWWAEYENRLNRKRARRLYLKTKEVPHA